MGQLVGVGGVGGAAGNYLPNKFKESMMSSNYGRSSLFGMFVRKLFYSMNS
jgi:hypothetical protein